jgi:hypothetical protein
VAEPAVLIDPEAEVSEDMAQIRALLERSEIEAARALIQELAVKWPASDRVQHMAKVLAPPIARVVKGQSGRSLQPEREWLSKHGHEYPGCWVAVYGDRLIAAAPDFDVVLDAVEGAEGVHYPLVVLQPGVPE